MNDNESELIITTEFIRLDAALKFAAEVGTGGEAKRRIQGGEISVNGETCVQRGKKLVKGDTFSVNKKVYKIARNN
jgi:ribosome-associated protein